MPSLTSVIIVPTLALADQWHIALTDDLGIRDQDIAYYSGSSHPAGSASVNLMVLNTARQLAPPIYRANPAHLLVADECHRFAGPVNSEALGDEHYATLGLSATPESTYDESYDERVAPVLGPVIYRYGYEEAFRDGVIVPFRLSNVRVALTGSEQQEYDRLTARVRALSARARRGEGVETQIKAALLRRASVSNNAKSRVPTAVKLLESLQGRRAIVFHERIASAELILKGLQSRGMSASLYHSAMSDALRRSNLRLFRRGACDVLVTCRALDEGFDVPEAEVAVIASSTASPRQRIQRLGRVLRSSNAKDIADVFTLYATDIEETRLAKEAGKMAGIAKVQWMRATYGGTA
jgi:superfamily II DNA or RNA helicase